MEERKFRYSFKTTDGLKNFLEASGYSKLVVNHHINYLLEKWEDIVRNYREIHNNLWEEYLNDLDGRAIIDEILQFFEESERREICPLLEKADQLFIENSVETKNCVWGSYNEERHHYTRAKEWYYYRVISCYDNDYWFKYNVDSRPLQDRI